MEFASRRADVAGNSPRVSVRQKIAKRAASKPSGLERAEAEFTCQPVVEDFCSLNLGFRLSLSRLSVILVLV